MAASSQTRTAAKYNLAFTAGALLLQESIAAARCYMETKSWHSAKEQVLRENLLRKDTSATSHRTFREARGRLQTLTRGQLACIVEGSAKDAAALLLIAACKRYAFINEFISEVLLEKAQVFDFTLRDSDYNRFWDERAMNDPGIEATSPKTQNKIRQTLLRLLREAGLLKGADGRTITPLLPSEQVVELVSRDDWRLLRLFLYAEADMRRAKTKYAN